MGGKKKHHQQKKERNSDDQMPTDQVEQKEQAPQETNQIKFEPIAPKKVSYCPICSLSFQLCRYGKDPIACAAFLYKLAPAKVTKYHPDFKPEMIEQAKEKKEAGKKAETEDPQGNIQGNAQGKEAKQAKIKSLKDKYIVIDVKNRGKKNFVTTVSGLNNFNVDAKQLAKKCSKKFAVSCSAIELGTVQLQGDNFESMRDYLISQYKQVKKKYILDKETFNEKQAEQKAKRKEAKKIKDGAIKEEPEEQQKPEEIVKDKNTIRMEMMQKLQQEQEQDDE